MIFEDKGAFAKFKLYSDIPKEDYMERIKMIESDNEVFMFYEKINEIVRFY